MSFTWKSSRRQGTGYLGVSTVNGVVIGIANQCADTPNAAIRPPGLAMLVRALS